MKFRNNGAIGALLDEYEKALNELILSIDNLTKKELTIIVDFETEDEDCRSIQTILTHIIRAGYNYVVEVRRSLGETIGFIDYKTLNTVGEYKQGLEEMFKYNEELFKDYPNLQLEEYCMENKILVKWGQRYDVEQLFEHAIVHVLRHRRQIERFLIKIK